MKACQKAALPTGACQKAALPIGACQKAALPIGRDTDHLTGTSLCTFGFVHCTNTTLPISGH